MRRPAAPTILAHPRSLGSAGAPLPAAAGGAGRTAVMAATTAVALLLGACVTTTTRPGLDPGAGAQTREQDAAPVLRDARAPIAGGSARLDLRPLGSIPTDRVTLPVLSPDGRHLAVQTGVAPDLATALARTGQRPPLASRIALYRIGPGSIVRLGETDGGLVLGRAADDRGVLVESPRPDGTRWIGRIAWEGELDEIEWLVQDGQVNAFATLGPRGELAYSARDPLEPRFDLVVRGAGGLRRLSGEGVRSLVQPVFSPDGSTIWFLALRDGVVELASADPSSGDALRQSLTRAFVTDRGDDETAARMVAPQGVRDGATDDGWIVYHPALGGLARWNAIDGVRPFGGGTLVVARLPDGREVHLSGESLRLRSPDDPTGPGTTLLEELAVPRTLGVVDGASALLLVVPERQGVRLVVLRVL
jgi:hypothetical protein